MNIRYRVDLDEAEQAQLAALLNGGTHAVRKIKRAQILLAADTGASDDVVAGSVSAAILILAVVLSGWRPSEAAATQYSNFVSYCRFPRFESCELQS